MHTTPWMLATLSLLVLGCSAADSKDDDEASPDTNADEDDAAEEDLSDDDGDGFTNAEEALAGTNPDYAYSHPYAGNYNVGFCSQPYSPTGPTGTGINDNDVTWTAYQTGDVPENWTMPDQHGEDVDLFSFCGQHIMLSFSAGWCGPCRSLAMELQALQFEYEDQGVQIIEVITGDNADNPADHDFLADWAEDYGFSSIPVVAAPRATSWDALVNQWELDMYIPTLYHVAPSGEIVSADDAAHDPGAFL